ncbi:GtrA family protein [uncultured Alistipes sp.]|jgi:putative flippase GtrA|uniref:GtrA family protein n=1 Tax=uncultured Alistipes sp. TaxID=538949 RepID=UPI002593E516|nr:GtrA family protein [uncultured Alistipes sp.]
MIAQLFIKPANKGKIQLFRYFFVGGAAFVVDFGLLWLLTEWGLSYLLSAAFSFVAGLTINYALSVRWVFRDHTLHSHIIEFVFFAAIGVVGLGMNEAIMWMATELAGLYYLGSKLISTAVVFFWNFTARKYLLFYGKK